MINIVLADDHQVVRKGLKALLCSEPDFNIIGEAENGLETIDLVERVKPDILVLDIMMPGINGLEVARQLNQKSVKTAIVVLSMHSSDAYVLEAFRSGVKAYILKDSPSEDLVYAIREVMSGHSFLSPPLCESANHVCALQMETSIFDPHAGLTKREQEIFLLSAQGYSSTEIALRLYISSRTVETHRNNIMRKLGIHNQLQLVRYAIQKGLIPTNGD